MVRVHFAVAGKRMLPPTQFFSVKHPDPSTFPSLNGNAAVAVLPFSGEKE
jgi:hypothetical protein